MVRLAPESRAGGRRSAAAALLLLAISCSAFEQEVSTADARATLEKQIPELMERYGIPGVALALIEEGEPSWSAAWGYADRKRQTPMSSDTLVRAESISKSLTAWGIMRLADRGMLDLDEPVEGHLPTWPPGGDTSGGAQTATAGVSARALLSHTAGIAAGGIYPNIAPEEPLPPLETVLAGTDTIAPAELQDKPGKQFAYSNPGFALLEALIEAVTEKRFSEYMATEILEPLGMHDSTFAWSDRVASDLATAHLLDGTPVDPYREPAKAHGGLYTTADDLARFVAAGAKPGAGPDDLSADNAPASDAHDVLRPASIETMYDSHATPESFHALLADSVGLGHFIEELPDGRTGILHGGQGTGTLAWSHFIAESGDGIVIVTNSERSFPLLASVLSSWGESLGARPTVARRYEGIRTTVAGATATAALLAAWRAGALILGLTRGTRRFATPGRQSVLLLALAVATILLAALLRSLKMLAVALPVLSGYLVWTLIALGTVVAVHSVCCRANR